MTKLKVFSTIIVLIAALFALFALPAQLTQLTQKAGVVQSRPDDVAGVWVVDDQPFYATTLTEVTQFRGEVTGGVCVQVHFMENGQTFLINKVERASPAACGGQVTSLEQTVAGDSK